MTLKRIEVFENGAWIGPMLADDSRADAAFSETCQRLRLPDGAWDEERRRAILWFTERGWKSYGTRLEFALRSRGVRYRIIERVATPDAIVYSNSNQVGVLPTTVAAPNA